MLLILTAMPKKLPFKDLLQQYNYFLLDAYGVFWESSEAGLFQKAKEAMALLVSEGKRVGILSNSTQLTLKEKFAKHGLQEGLHYHFLLTSGHIAHDLLIYEKLPFATPQKKYWLFGTEHPRFSNKTIFEGTLFQQTKDLAEADFIYTVVPHIDGIDQEKPDIFLKEIKQIAGKGIPILCANPDHFAHEGLPSCLVVRQGMIAHLLQTHGAEVHYIGKPFPMVYEAAMRLFPEAVKPEEILMIGDTPETDIRGARQLGMATALVTETGIMKERLKEDIQYFAHLPQSDQPDFVIGSLEIHVQATLKQSFLEQNVL